MFRVRGACSHSDKDGGENTAVLSFTLSFHSSSQLIKVVYWKAFLEGTWLGAPSKVQVNTVNLINAVLYFSLAMSSSVWRQCIYREY